MVTRDRWIRCFSFRTFWVSWHVRKRQTHHVEGTNLLGNNSHCDGMWSQFVPCYLSCCSSQVLRGEVISVDGWRNVRCSEIFSFHKDNGGIFDLWAAHEFNLRDWDWILKYKASSTLLRGKGISSTLPLRKWRDRKERLNLSRHIDQVSGKMQIPVCMSGVSFWVNKWKEPV